MPWPTSGSHRRTQSCWGENNLSLRSQGLFYMELESNFGLGPAPSFWLKKCCIGRFLLKKIWPFNILTFNEVCYILLWIFLTALRDFSRMWQFLFVLYSLSRSRKARLREDEFQLLYEDLVMRVLKEKISFYSSVAEPVEPKLFWDLEPEPEINFNIHFLQSVWKMLEWRKGNCYLY